MNWGAMSTHVRTIQSMAKTLMRPCHASRHRPHRHRPTTPAARDSAYARSHRSAALPSTSFSACNAFSPATTPLATSSSRAFQPERHRMLAPRFVVASLDNGSSPRPSGHSVSRLSVSPVIDLHCQHDATPGGATGTPIRIATHHELCVAHIECEADFLVGILVNLTFSYPHLTESRVWYLSKAAIC